MIINLLNLLLDDDDMDYCFLLNEAIEELPVNAKLTIVNDGVQLTQLLTGKETTLPNAVFLELNMPRISGFECLLEIKSVEKLQTLLIFVFFTSFDKDVKNILYHNGAYHYIRKPGEYNHLKINDFSGHITHLPK